MDIMRAVTIALKDVRVTLKNGFSLAMMFAAPLIITGLLYFAFSGIGSGAQDKEVQPVRIGVVSTGNEENTIAGLFTGFLQRDEFRSSISVRVLHDAGQARTAVRDGTLSAAVIFPDLPAEQVLIGAAKEITVLEDPASAVHAAAAEAWLEQFLDVFTGAGTAVQAAASAFLHAGIPFTKLTADTVRRDFITEIEKTGHSSAVTYVTGNQPDTGFNADDMISMITAGMIVFFIFFMGANSAQSLLREKESGTLSRLLTAPVSETTLILGKFLSVLIVLIIQITVLLAAARFLFSIHWGGPGGILITSVGLITASAGFGIFIISLLKSERQVGPVLGGVLTITGMLGGLFTVAVPNMPDAFDTVGLFMPQGWGLRIFSLMIRGRGVSALMPPFTVLVSAGVVFAAAGIFMIHRRIRRR